MIQLWMLQLGQKQVIVQRIHSVRVWCLTNQPMLRASDTLCDLKEMCKSGQRPEEAAGGWGLGG